MEEIFEQSDSDFYRGAKELFRLNNITIQDIRNHKVNYEKVSSILHEFITSEIRKGNILDNIVKDHDKEQTFFDVYNSVWGNAINVSYLFVSMLEDVCEKIKIIADEENIKAFVLAKLMGKAIRTYHEILTLIKNGFPYGAASLTRTLMELMIITRFIEENNKEVALAYYKASDIPLYEQKDNYKWAHASGKFSKNKNITLKKLRESCGMIDSKYSDIYAFHCKFAHASPQIVNYDFGSTSDDTYMGPTLFAVNIAGCNATLFLRAVFIDFANHTVPDELVIESLICSEFASFVFNEFDIAANRLNRLIESGELKALE